MKNYFLVAASLITIACGAGKFIPPAPAQADADRISSKFPGVTLAELNEGKALYEAQCQNCHGLKKPVKYSEAKWRNIVPEMAVKANKKAKKEVVDAAGQELILKYVLAVSGK